MGMRGWPSASCWGGAMQSRGKARQTAAERDWVQRLADLPCVVCGAHGVEIHEFEQGQWHTAVPLCPACHRGSQGWHGDRTRWTLRRMDMLKAINAAVAAVFARVRHG